MVKVHYALQTCNISSNQKVNRYCSSDKSEIVRKCVTSFLTSVEYASLQRPESEHVIQIIDDHSTADLLEFLDRCVARFSSSNVTIKISHLENGGVMNSIRACYEWLESNGSGLVFQVQDDYLFEPTAIFEMIDVWMQVNLDLETDAIVYQYNNPCFWRTIYHYKVTPRVIFPGAGRYWLQCYDIPCTFLTSKEQFSKHWDLYEIFFNTDPHDHRLESLSLNKILVERGVLGVQPFASVGLHMQGDYEKDPYIDWKMWWDSVEEV